MGKSPEKQALLLSSFASINDPHVRSGFLVLVDLLKAVDDPVVVDTLVTAFQDHVERWEQEKLSGGAAAAEICPAHRWN
ncbi:hypothetical protein ACSHT0_15305 [Tepidicaulis sp. LMO-SS28]|uniref:hypothetical protein n=1 Tax=Tepidicaulis sp. LMO-SS28 TaxID=3447455 RepID=UPI003EE219BB